MTVVLGIDAAWTTKNPSGIALAASDGSNWHLLAAEPSYDHFFAKAEGRRLTSRPTGATPDAGALLEASHRIAGTEVDLVAVDMPLAYSPIVKRRVSDHLVSVAYGGRGAATHTPNSTRPGGLSDAFRVQFGERGYHLQTLQVQCPCLIEVYPHPALIELLGASRRLEYKFGKVRRYWPAEEPFIRTINLWRVWREIAMKLESECRGVDESLYWFNPQSTISHEWKAYEDMLDAIVCAVVGICAIEARAIPFGDKDSAIWIPKPGTANRLCGLQSSSPAAQNARLL